MTTPARLTAAAVCALTAAQTLSQLGQIRLCCASCGDAGLLSTERPGRNAAAAFLGRPAT